MKGCFLPFLPVLHFVDLFLFHLCPVSLHWEQDDGGMPPIGAADDEPPEDKEVQLAFFLTNNAICVLERNNFKLFVDDYRLLPFFHS